MSQASPSSPSPFALGMLAAVAGNVLWGSVFPMYFYHLGNIDSMEILAHRMWGAALVLLLLLPFAGRYRMVAAVFRDPRALGVLALTALLIAGNWLTYIWAVGNGMVLQASIGYYLTPLISVGLSWLFLGERQSRIQLLALGLATVGIGLKIGMSTSFPWVALVLGFSFAIYGLLRKQVAVGPISGLFVEAALLTPLAFVYLAWLASGDHLAFPSKLEPEQVWMVLGLGVITVLPLYLFNTGAKALPYSLAGMLFYIVPTLLFLTGVFVFHEPWGLQDALVFTLIWGAVALYLFGVFHKSRGSLALNPAE